MKNVLPENGSRCEKCKKGIVYWNAGGATCDWCGVTQRGRGLATFDSMPNGSVFLLPDYYPASTHYPHSERIMVKALHDNDFPTGRKHRNNNCYDVNNPDSQGACGGGCDVVPMEKIGLLKSG